MNGLIIEVVFHLGLYCTYHVFILGQTNGKVAIVESVCDSAHLKLHFVSKDQPRKYVLTFYLDTAFGNSVTTFSYAALVHVYSLNWRRDLVIEKLKRFKL